MNPNPSKFDLIRGVTFAHPTIMIKSEVLKNLNGYSIEACIKQLEDYELWCRFYKSGYKGVNLEMSLYLYREDDDAYKRRNSKRRIRQIRLKHRIIKSLDLPVYAYSFILKDLAILVIPSGILKHYYKNKVKNKN